MANSNKNTDKPILVLVVGVLLSWLLLSSYNASSCNTSGDTSHALALIGPAVIMFIAAGTSFYLWSNRKAGIEKILFAVAAGTLVGFTTLMFVVISTFGKCFTL
jgi:hypothetical protein